MSIRNAYSDIRVECAATPRRRKGHGLNVGNVGRYLRQRRLALHLTQQQVVERSNDQLSQNYISQVELGKLRPGTEKLAAFADVLGESLADLLQMSGVDTSSMTRKEVVPIRDGRSVPLRGIFRGHRWTAYGEGRNVPNVPAEWLRNARYPVFAVEVSGDGFRAKHGLLDGDVVVCEEYHGQDVPAGWTVLVATDDGALRIAAWGECDSTSVVGVKLRRFG